MSDKKKAASGDIDWLGMQRKYLDALAAFGGGNPFAEANPFGATPPFEPFNPFATPAGPTPGPAWMNAMNDWWKSARPAAQDDTRNFFGKVLEQSRHYWFMSEQFSKLIEGIAQYKGNNKAILEFINKKFGELESACTATNHPALAHLIAQYEGLPPFMQSALSGLSNWFESGAGAFAPGAEASRLRARLLSAPGLGYSREAQDKFQELLRLWAEYQDNYQEYQSVMTELNRAALALMRKKIIELSKNDKDINSMKQLYDLWVESNERAYGEYVFTDEYAELNGRLVNSLMAFRQKHNEISEDILAAMNMPTMRAMNTLERRQYQLRKQLKAVEAELKALKSQQQARDQAAAPAKAGKEEQKAAPVTAKKRARRAKKTAAAKAAAPGAKKKSTGRAKKKTTGPAPAGIIEVKL